MSKIHPARLTPQRSVLGLLQPASPTASGCTTRTSDAGHFLAIHGKTLASEEASYNSQFGRTALCRSYLSFILNTRPSEKTTFPVFPPENPTGAPFLDGARVIVIWSPGLIEFLFQPFLWRMPGL